MIVLMIPLKKLKTLGIETMLILTKNIHNLLILNPRQHKLA